MSKKKKFFKIQWQLIFLFLPIAIFPLIIAIVFSSVKFADHLKVETNYFYYELLQQVASNIDSMYTENILTLSNLVKNPQIKSQLWNEQYTNKQDEINRSHSLISSRGGIRNTTEEKIDGTVVIGELDKKSLIDNTNYKVHYTSMATRDIIIPKLLEDPLFIESRKRKSDNILLGKLKEGTVSHSRNGNRRAGMIFPVFPDPSQLDRSNFKKFIFIALFPQTIEKMYKNIQKLKYGTLYIIDQFGQIFASNHPNTLDYYEYDNEINQYTLLEDDDPDDPYEKMSFKEYKMLNTDEKILEAKEIKNILDTTENYNEEDVDISIRSKLIRYKNTDYLTISTFAPNSKIKLLFFLPTYHILKPIYRVIEIIIFLTILISALIILASIIITKKITAPITKLSDAVKEVSTGNYNFRIDTKYNNEVGLLANGFNNMITEIKNYQNKLLSAEIQKSEMKIASNIQTSLTPEVKSTEYYDISAIMIPAEDIGGDYYDIITNDSDQLWLGIGDVSGHGLTAGLIMMMVQTSFNTILMNRSDISPGQLLDEVNKITYHNIKERLGSDHFMTLSFLQAYPDGKINYSGAHLDILVYRSQINKVERIKTSGIWLGIIPNSKNSYAENHFNITKGDVVLLYTDGLIESMNINNEQYDMNRLMKILKKSGTKSVVEIKDDIITDLFSFIHKQIDDITLLAIKMK